MQKSMHSTDPALYTSECTNGDAAMHIMFLFPSTTDVSLPKQPSSTTNERQYKAYLYYIIQINFVASNAKKKTILC